jgi:outer membrane protein assembly factor BamB
LWKIETGSVISTEAVIADRKIAITTVDGTLYIVDAESGKTCETANLGESQTTSAALSDGRLIIGQSDGTITCFEGSPFWGVVPLVIGSVVIISVLVFFWCLKKRSSGSAQ